MITITEKDVSQVKAKLTPEPSPTDTKKHPISSPPQLRRPNKIGKTITSPNSKADRKLQHTRVVRCVATKHPGIAIYWTSKMLDRLHDGYNYPISKAVDENNPFVADTNILFHAKMKGSPDEDEASTNSDGQYLRRTFIQIDTESNVVVTKQKRKETIDKICAVCSVIYLPVSFHVFTNVFPPSS